ncbi:hypothetical protein GLOIN_2v1643960 [Rhizophagus clarus]|uniref:Uncharacterized protein n=1 Tax=Rhizophagus clarus TaxID=94130 RepID=A0A140D0A9_9GLOM|nr:hypothetical protein [Rhizophagus clarus]GET01450.1 hypothetical protein GLOIN_2v1643960 [Rhizophagus clarus]
MNRLFLIITFIVLLTHNFDYVASQCKFGEPFYNNVCQSDLDCSKYPGYVCSNNPKSWAKYRTCIFGCHSDDDCLAESNSKCIVTPYPHWFCSCSSDADCQSFGRCYNGICSTFQFMSMSMS